MNYIRLFGVWVAMWIVVLASISILYSITCAIINNIILLIELLPKYPVVILSITLLPPVAFFFLTICAARYNNQ